MKPLNFQRRGMDHSNLSLEDRLKIECLRRTSNGSLPQLLMVIFAWTLVQSGGPAYSIGFFLIIILQMIRFYWFQKNIKDFKTLLMSYNWLMLLSLGTALTWSLLALLAFFQYKLSSPQGAIFELNILGYLAGITYSLASMPRVQKLFILVVAAPLVIAPIFETNSSFAFAAAGLAITLLIYMFAISINHAADLLHTYRTESDLRSEREKLRTVINSVPGFVAMANPQGSWIEASESFKEFSKIQTLQDLQKKFQQSNSETYAQEVEWDDKGGPNSFVVSFARLRHQMQNSVIMVGVPINELKAVRRQMELQRSKAEYSARLSTIGEMAGGIAHEINSPLAIIVNAAFYLKLFLEENSIQNKEALDTLEKIENTAFRINSIIRSLQYFAKQGDEEPFTETTASVIFENSLPLFQQKFADHQIEFHVGSIPERPILAKPMQIGQVLINLLNNAYDAVSNSKIKKIELLFREESEGLVFSVVDSGPGISIENIDRIFEPFYTTKEVGQGTGLGLPVSKGIIEAHRGRITVQSAPGRTVFEFLIPWKK